MNTTGLWLGIFCLGMAVAVFVFAEGLRRWYSGGFFTVMGIVILVNAFGWNRKSDQKIRSGNSHGQAHEQ